MNINENTYAILLAEDENSTTVDRSALRRLGIRNLRVMTVGSEALSLLQSNLAYAHVSANLVNASSFVTPVFSTEHAGYEGSDASGLPDIIICNENIADMDILSFMEDFYELELNIPVLLLRSGGRIGRETLLNSGVSAILDRPYTMSQMESCLGKLLSQHPLARTQRSAQYRRNNFSSQPARASVNSWGTNKLMNNTLGRTAGAVKRQGADTPTPAMLSQALTRKALGQIRVDELQEAEVSISKALELDPMNAEACLAMARLARDEQKLGGVMEWMQRAGGAYLRKGDIERAQTVFRRIPGYNNRRQGDGPFVLELTGMLKDELYTEAARAFIHMHEANPELSLPHMISRACQFTEHPEQCMREICHVLEHSGHESTAKILHRRMLQTEIPHHEAQPSGFWSKFPRLYEVVSIAGYTMQSWRQAGI